MGYGHKNSASGGYHLTEQLLSIASALPRSVQRV